MFSVLVPVGCWWVSEVVGRLETVPRVGASGGNALFRDWGSHACELGACGRNVALGWRLLEG